jgi:rhodanese-related sulfurtransferase
VLNGFPKKLLIDCRPPEQFDILRFEEMPNVVHIPLDRLKFMSKAEIEGRLVLAPSDTTDKTKMYVFCRSGVTSQQAVEYLNKLGFESFNIAKGLVGYRDYSGYDFSALQ